MIPVKETKEVVVGYQADDGTRFKTEEECRKYEESFAGAAAKVARLFQRQSMSLESAFGQFCGCCEDDVVLYDVKDMYAMQCINTHLQTLDKHNSVLTPEHIGSKVLVGKSPYDGYAYILGTRQRLEEVFSEMLDHLFDVDL